jgi:hypothetical protein
MIPIPLLPLYAEIHFKFFRLFPSLIFKKNPEVIFDLPRRLNPGMDLPIVLLLNDIDRFPAHCREVKITISQKNRPQLLFQFIDLQRNIIEQPFSFQNTAYVFSIPRNKLENGLCFINCTAAIIQGNKSQTVLNDNLPTTSKLPFSCYIADEPLPENEFCSYGDLHVHSHFSQSHVEFGPPVCIIDLFAKCYGADFTGITDHSYDLSCSMENYLVPDKTLNRWNFFQQELSRKDFKSFNLQSEEVSCLNSKGKAVHLCGFGLDEFIPGTIDGARKNAVHETQHSIGQAVSLIHKQNGVAFAAHPGSKTGFMQRIFLKRGTWSKHDLSSGIDGLQAINNGFGVSWNRAKALWIKELLKGRKISIIAGNDSHGDFNRYRFLSIPFLAIGEMFGRHFCSAMTGTYEKIKSKKQLIDILRNGKTFTTSGPLLCMSTSDSIEDCVIGKDTINFKQDSVTLILTSTYEFGEPFCVKLFQGSYAEKKEKLIFVKYFKNQEFAVNVQAPLSIFRGQHGYLRAEGECKKPDGTMTYAATSPCYL